MATRLVLCSLLSLLLPLGTSQEGAGAQNAPADPPSAPQIQDLLRKGETAQLNAQRTQTNTVQDSAKVGLFIAAAFGTVGLMAAVYCIYNKFYIKQQYLHAQLSEESDLSADPMDPPPVYFHACGMADERKSGYGSLCDTPSIISVPPCLSPPPAAMPFPPLFVSSRSLRTISAKDLEKNCL